MSKKILIYRKESRNNNIEPDLSPHYKLKVWKPGILNIIPPNKNIKYVLYWLFFVGGIFKNKNYFSYLLYDGNKVISSLLVIPKYFKWPFMGNNDVQFTYVMTNKNYTGQGLASRLLKKAMSDIRQEVDNFWYITDTENKASIRVAEKLGFKLLGNAQRTKVLKNLKLIERRF